MDAQYICNIRKVHRMFSCLHMQYAGQIQFIHIQNLLQSFYRNLVVGEKRIACFCDVLLLKMDT